MRPETDDRECERCPKKGAEAYVEINMPPVGMQRVRVFPGPSGMAPGRKDLSAPSGAPGSSPGREPGV
jgi:hypothetical protein